MIILASSLSENNVAILNMANGTTRDYPGKLFRYAHTA